MIYTFIYPKSVSKNLFFSQVLPFIEYLTKQGNICYVFFKRDLGISPSKFLIIKNGELNQILIKTDYVYTRNIFDFMNIFILSFTIRKFKIIHNFRGLASYEKWYVDKSRIKFIIFYILEFVAYRYSNHVSVVSHSLADFLNKKYGKKKSNVSVIPCCIYKKDIVDPDKIVGRSKLMKFVYVGSLTKWQKFKEILNLFMEINKNDQLTRLTIFTSEIEKAKKIVKNYKMIDVQYKERKELLIELKNYHFGFLMRDNVIMNQVASPIKFAEYISCGLIPIISKNVGDYSKLVKNKKIGLVLNEQNKIQNLNKLNELHLDEGIKQRLYDTANSLTWEQNLDKFNFEQ